MRHRVSRRHNHVQQNYRDAQSPKPVAVRSPEWFVFPHNCSIRNGQNVASRKLLDTIAAGNIIGAEILLNHPPVTRVSCKSLADILKILLEHAPGEANDVQSAMGL